ncbi:hypothetical protein N665_0113s0002 [Sinapis alba]|nr:hypothetical protein N665_0113s0002 [Sinapis alba]
MGCLHFLFLLEKQRNGSRGSSSEGRPVVDDGVGEPRLGEEACRSSSGVRGRASDDRVAPGDVIAAVGRRVEAESAGDLELVVAGGTSSGGRAFSVGRSSEEDGARVSAIDEVDFGSGVDDRRRLGSSGFVDVNRVTVLGEDELGAGEGGKRGSVVARRASSSRETVLGEFVTTEILDVRGVDGPRGPSMVVGRLATGEGRRSEMGRRATVSGSSSIWREEVIAGERCSSEGGRRAAAVGDLGCGGSSIGNRGEHGVVGRGLNCVEQGTRSLSRMFGRPEVGSFKRGSGSSEVVHSHVLPRREEFVGGTIERREGYRGLRWSSEGGLIDGFVVAGFDEHGSNLDKVVGLVSEFNVVDGGDGGAGMGPRLFAEPSMRDRLAAADKLVAEGKVDESSSTSGSSSSTSSSSSSSDSGSVSSSSESSGDVGDRVAGSEREVVDDHFQVVESLSDPTSSCSSDKEPVLGSIGEVGVGGIVVDGDVERHPSEGETANAVTDERFGASDGYDEGVAVSDEYGGVSTGEFSEVKGESFDFSYPSYADYSSTIDLADGEMEQKIKKPRKKSCRMGPFLDHPRDSKSSTVTAAKLEWIAASCCTDGAVEVRMPGLNERPWTVPDGWVCLYDFWFSEYHMWFPLPKLLLAYCDERRIALSQLTPGSIRNVVGALVLAAECGVHMSLYFLEEIIKITPGETYGTFYLSMKSGRCFVREDRRKTFDWIRRFFYVRITPSSVSDMSRPLMTNWNPYHDRHTVGVPFAPGYKECLAYVDRSFFAKYYQYLKCERGAAALENGSHFLRNVNSLHLVRGCLRTPQAGIKPIVVHLYKKVNAGKDKGGGSS